MSAPQDPLEENPGRMKSALVATGALAFAVSPLFAPFSGFEPSQFAVPQVDPPAQPAGYAFAIWLVIYLWILAHGIYGLVARSEDPAWDRTRWPMLVVLVPGAVWTSVANTSPIWATILIFVMLGGAIAALFATPPGQDRWLLRAPIALLAGWLTAASFAGLAIVAAGNGLLFGATVWAIIVLIAATRMAVAVQRRLGGTPEYAVAVVWALIGIVVHNLSGSLLIALLALLAAGAVAAVWFRTAR